MQTAQRIIRVVLFTKYKKTASDRLVDVGHLEGPADVHSAGKANACCSAFKQESLQEHYDFQV